MERRPRGGQATDAARRAAGGGLWPAAMGRLQGAAGRMRAFVEYMHQAPLSPDEIAGVLGPECTALMPGIRAASGAFGSVLCAAFPPPPTHIDLRIEEGSLAAAEGAIAEYAQRGRRRLGAMEHLEAGMIFAVLGRHRAALAAYGRVAVAGNYPLVLFCVGVSLALLGRHGEACRAHEEALRVMPGFEAARVALEISRATLRNPGRLTGKSRPFTIVLVIGGNAPCAACGRPVRDTGHICPRVPLAASPREQRRAHCEARAPVHLCYARGLGDIGLFRLESLAAFGLYMAEFALVFTIPHMAPLAAFCRKGIGRWLAGVARRGQPALRDAVGRWRWRTVTCVRERGALPWSMRDQPALGNSRKLC